MASARAPYDRVDDYLNQLRRCMRGTDEQDIGEIVEELRSHLIEKATMNGELTDDGVDSALAALGSPQALAKEYQTNALLSRAGSTRSPLRLIRILLRWASLSVAGVLVLLGTVTGYSLGIVLVVCAVMKPFHPQSAGVWVLRDSTGEVAISLRAGLGSTPAAGRDLLGWWIVPLGLVLGCLLVMFTTRLASWCARQYRRSRPEPPS